MQTESQIKKLDSRLKTAGMTEGIPAGMTEGELFIPFAFSGAERRVFARKEKLTPSEWAEQRRIVTMGAHRGPWRNSISPHLVHIMDTWALPHVREVIICKSPQTGGTESQYNCAAYAMERDPSVMLFVMPRETDAKKTASDRIIPMLNDSPRLRELLSANPDDTASRRIKLNNGAIVYMAWSNSTSALASFPVKYIFFDEVDKYPPFIGKETDPITLGEKRARTFRYTHKIYKVSTPTREDGPIWKAYNKADVIFKYHIPCPKCGATQIMKFGQLKWPEATTQEEIKREGAARYVCEHCPAEWTDTDKDLAVHNGEWQAEKGKHIKRPRTIAYHLPSFISPDVSLSEIVSVYMQSKNDKAKLIDFYNDYLAEPFVESQQGDNLKEDDLYQRRYKFAPDGAAWQIPMNACILSAYADIQANRVEVCVIAWGQGYESWIIERAILPGDFAQEQVKGDLDRFLQKEYLHESGAKLRLVTAGIDSGYLAPEVYRFVRPRQLGRRIYATKGASTVGKPLISITDPRKKKGKDKGRVTLINIGTETAKDTLFARLQIESPGPGYVHFSDALDYDFFKQLCAEQCLTKYKGGRPYRVWEKKRQDIRNEALDMVVGNIAVIELLNPKFEAIAQKLKPVIREEIVPSRKEEPARQPRQPFIQKQKGQSWVKGWK